MSKLFALFALGCGPPEVIPPADADGDGYAVTDCDDEDATVHPGAPEIPYDGVDNDCDEQTPDDDLDGDGVLVADDCDDGNQWVWDGRRVWDGDVGADELTSLCDGACVEVTGSIREGPSGPLTPRNSSLKYFTKAAKCSGVSRAGSTVTKVNCTSLAASGVAASSFCTWFITVRVIGQTSGQWL